MNKFCNKKCDEDEEIPPFFSRRNVYRIGCDVYLYDEIDPETAFLVIKYLEEAADECYQNTSRSAALQGMVSSAIFLHINSPGGEVYSSFAIYDHIRSMELPVSCLIEGIAASGASIISQACAIRQMTENAAMLIHEVRSVAWGKYSDFLDEKVCLDLIMKKMKAIYMKRSKLTAEELDEVLRHDVIWDAAKCKELKLVDCILEDENQFDHLWDNIEKQADAEEKCCGECKKEKKTAKKEPAPKKEVKEPATKAKKE